MAAFEPRDPGFDARVRASFARQRAMATIGATVLRVAPGEVDITLPAREQPAAVASPAGAAVSG